MKSRSAINNTPGNPVKAEKEMVNMFKGSLNPK